MRKIEIVTRPNVRGVTVSLDGQLLGKGGPLLDHPFQLEANADNTDVVRLQNHICNSRRTQAIKYYERARHFVLY